MTPSDPGQGRSDTQHQCAGVTFSDDDEPVVLDDGTPEPAPEPSEGDYAQAEAKYLASLHGPDL